MMKKVYQLTITIITVIGLVSVSGCASLVSKTSYRMPINSNPSGARITVLDKKGRIVHMAATPTIVPLRSGAGFFKKAGYLVKFELDGYETRTVPVYFDINAWYFGNVVFGGLLGFLIIDPLTGAMWKLDTNYINETLPLKTTSVAEPTLEIQNYNSLPENVKMHLVRIN